MLSGVRLRGLEMNLQKRPGLERRLQGLVNFSIVYLPDNEKWVDLMNFSIFLNEFSKGEGKCQLGNTASNTSLRIDGFATVPLRLEQNKANIA